MENKMSDDKILNDHLQMLANVSARTRRAAETGTVRHARQIEGVARYYSQAERMNAERIERNQPKDVLGEVAKQKWTGHYPEQEERERRSREIEAQMLAEREAGAEVK
jgi:hypothetical protein